jgi:hypothetical protein
VIRFDIADDGIVEGLERLLIRLSAPTNGATLSAPNIASVYVSEPAATPVVSFARATIDVRERGFANAVVVVERKGSASGPVTVDFAITGGSAIHGSDYAGPASGTISWADGDAEPKWIEYAISDDASGEEMETFQLALSSASGATIGTNSMLSVEIADGDGANQAPNSIAGAAQTVASGSRVTLNGSQSNDPDGDTLSYAWTQTLGTAVALGNPNSASTSFTAPQVSSDTLLRFELTVMDSDGLTDVSTVAVTVSKAAAPPQTGGSGGGRVSLLMLLALAAIALRRVVSQTDES